MEVDKDLEEYRSLTKNYLNIGYDSWPEEVKQKADKYRSVLEKRYWSERSNHGLFVTIGGPLQTMLTGIIGIWILFWRRKLIKQNELKYLDWLAIFLSLFWLREIFNLITSLVSELISSNGTWFGGDELYISRELNLWDGTIPITFGMIGLLISVYIVFRVIPKEIRLTF